MDDTSLVGPDRVTELLSRRQRGRPTLYSQEFAEEICERIANRETLEKICDTPGMPSRSTVYHWMAERDDFARAYALAKVCVAEGLIDDIIAIADRTAEPFELPDGTKILVDPAVSANLRINNRLKVAALHAPRKYGAHIEPPPSPPPALPDPEDAKVVEKAERHPQYESLLAWRAAAKGAP